MENNEARHPTVEDFANGRKFCVIHLTVNSSELSARVTSRSTKIKKESDGFRINPYGMIEWINLGAVKFQGCSGYSFHAVIIDYAENESSALDAGRVFLETKRAKYVAEMSKEISDFEALKVEIKDENR